MQSSGGERVPWRVQLDVALAGGRERLHAAGLGGGGAPADRARAGVLLVLCAWAMFVIAGAGAQKFSEHWQDATPAVSRGLPSAAFDVLVVAAVVASVLVGAGIAATLPQVVSFLRNGGWPAIRRRVLAAASVSGVAIAATIVIVAWARGLTGFQRSGGDTAYAVAFVAWALLIAACLAAWTAVAVATARALDLPAATLRLQARIASAVAVAIGVMTAATGVWWVALAHDAPWFLAGRPFGAPASPIAPQLVAVAALMVLATLLAASGARRAVRALPALAQQPAT